MQPTERVDIAHPDVPGTQNVSAARARVMAKSGWRPVKAPASKSSASKPAKAATKRSSTTPTPEAPAAAEPQEG